MTLQFIHDNKGNTTGVFIPIEDWQKQIVEDRLNDYYKNSNEITAFDETLVNIENSLKVLQPTFEK